MSQEIQNNLETAQLLLYTQIEELQNSPNASSKEVQAKIAELQLAINNTEKLQGFIAANFPELSPPVVDLESLKKLTGGKAVSAEALLEALNLQERKNAIQEGLNSIEARAKEKAEASRQKLDELKDKIQEEKDAANMSWWEKAFKWIGMVAGAIAAVAGMVAGVAGCIAGGSGALLIAGSAILLAMTINSMVTEATGGEHGMGVAIAKGLEAAGVDAKTAQIIGVVTELVITLVGAIMTGGTGSSSLANMASKLGDIVGKVVANGQKVAAFISAAAGFAGGAMTVVNAVRQYERAMSEAFMKELEALMQRLEVADEMDLDNVEALMQQFNDLIAQVQQLVETTTQANISIASGAPSMA